MSTEQGFQSRGGARRHRRLKPAPVGGGSRQEITTAFAKIDPSLKEREKRVERSRLRFAASELGEVHRRALVITEWLDALDPLARENAELLLRQQVIDGRAAERSLGYDDLPDEPDSEELRGFLHAVHFDRADDVWMYKAEQGRKRAYGHSQH